MVIKQFAVGNTSIKINDDAVVKTPEEVAAILRRCAEIAARSEKRGQEDAESA